MRLMITTAAAALMLAVAPMTASAQQASPPGADVPALPGGLSIRALAMMDRVSDPRVSPDGRRVLYSVRSTDWEGNRGVSALWMVPAASGEPVKLAISAGGASSGRWAIDGQAIYFLSARGGSNQVWRADVQGNAAVQVTTLPVDVVAFKVSPDGKNLILALPVFIDCQTLQCTKDRIDADNRSPSTVTGYDRMPLRQFDHWNDGRRQHLFVQPLNGSGLADGQPRDLMAGVDADTPSQPQGTEDEFAISPDGRTVVYSTQTQGAGEAFTNNSDLFRVSIDGGATINLTEANHAADGSPAYSPDGRRLAWLAGRRENVGGDQAVVMVADADGANARVLVDDWDRGPGNLRWRSDGRSLLTTTADNGVQRLYQIDARSGDVEALSGSGSITMMDEAHGVLVVGDEDFSLPPDLYVYASGDGPWRTLTTQNAATMTALDLPSAERFEFEGWNDEFVQGWVFKPVGYVEGRTYPAVYLIHGGPKSPWTESWSYRWNPQIYTSAGYAVVMVNFHGSPGYGQAFTDAINNHWGDRPLEDLQKGWAAALAANPFIDGDRACALGASYGGYMVNLIAGKWNGPWRCLVNHAGVFDVPQLMNAMDLGNFIWEFGGPSWERMDLYRGFSPGDFAGDWTKPMLILHGSRDFRVPIDQGLATFSALQRQGIPSRFVHVPDENHWVLKPRNYVDWQREILDWTARWTAEAP
ncbi:S9 family peptidase [Brevundimonas sp. NIBR11]|uniref:dipeptidyl-peptidase 5 n=1 Tax=Brevundimonas sp. NIBR11 TaxID=3015999 RepID=UPI0022EFFFAD|nr:S9 family peptidase [Brevundimonas sp. NIBR11]WGM29965.1 Dipeptidyl-peptidase 5 [Brevundimonas sp. NIBR11]